MNNLSFSFGDRKELLRSPVKFKPIEISYKLRLHHFFYFQHLKTFLHENTHILGRQKASANLNKISFIFHHKESFKIFISRFDDLLEDEWIPKDNKVVETEVRKIVSNRVRDFINSKTKVGDCDCGKAWCNRKELEKKGLEDLLIYVKNLCSDRKVNKELAKNAQSYINSETSFVDKTMSDDLSSNVNEDPLNQDYTGVYLEIMNFIDIVIEFANGMIRRHNLPVDIVSEIVSMTKQSLDCLLIEKRLAGN